MMTRRKVGMKAFFPKAALTRPTNQSAPSAEAGLNLPEPTHREHDGATTAGPRSTDVIHLLDEAGACDQEARPGPSTWTSSPGAHRPGGCGRAPIASSR